MAKRATIILDDDLDKKVRALQAKEISQSVSSISFSFHLKCFCILIFLIDLK
ncbi:MAG: hypothetical protein AABX09_05770 [Thermoproteota archaeon]